MCMIVKLIFLQNQKNCTYEPVPSFELSPPEEMREENLRMADARDSFTSQIETLSLGYGRFEEIGNNSQCNFSVSNKIAPLPNVLPKPVGRSEPSDESLERPSDIKSSLFSTMSHSSHKASNMASLFLEEGSSRKNNKGDRQAWRCSQMSKEKKHFFESSGFSPIDDPRLQARIPSGKLEEMKSGYALRASECTTSTPKSSAVQMHASGPTSSRAPFSSKVCLVGALVKVALLFLKLRFVPAFVYQRFVTSLVH